MHWLTKYKNKECHTVICTHNMAHIIQQPSLHKYVAVNLVSTGVPLLLMQGWLLNNVGHVMECISLCGIPWLCTLSASAFIELSLHQLDFFLKSFYGDLFQFFYGVHHGCLEIIGSHSTQTVVLLETKYKRPIHGKFSHINGYFNCVTAIKCQAGWRRRRR